MKESAGNNRGFRGCVRERYSGPHPL